MLPPPIPPFSSPHFPSSRSVKGKLYSIDAHQEIMRKGRNEEGKNRENMNEDQKLDNGR